MSSATITTSARLMNSTPQTEEQAMVRKVAVSSFLGNFIEWFDYASYSYFATTIALVFFPTDNHTVAMLQTFVPEAVPETQTSPVYGILHPASNRRTVLG